MTIHKQNHARKAIHRPLHRHDSICELLLVYRGTGTYYVNGKSYPLSEGSVIYYNQGDLHEVISETENEIGDYCIGITNLHRCNLPPNCLISPDEPSVQHAGGLFPMLRSMCEALGCSATYISHIFKKATGRTPIQYMIHRRIGHAQTLLISTDHPVTRIATIVGYDNTNYFSTIFSKVVGMSPARYREFYKEEMKGQKDQS